MRTQWKWLEQRKQNLRFKKERRGKETKRGKSTLALALVLGVGERLERVSENRHANHFDCLFGKGVLSKE